MPPKNIIINTIDEEGSYKQETLTSDIIPFENGITVTSGSLNITVPSGQSVTIAPSGSSGGIRIQGDGSLVALGQLTLSGAQTSSGSSATIAYVNSQDITLSGLINTKADTTYVDDAIIALTPVVRNRVLHVAIDGSDGLGNGSLDRPYFTVIHALSLIPDNGLTVDTSYTIMLGAGNHSTSSCRLKPFVALVGLGYTVSRLTVEDGSISLESGYGSDSRNQIHNLELVNTNITLDYSQYSDATSILDIVGCQIKGSLACIGRAFGQDFINISASTVEARATTTNCHIDATETTFLSRITFELLSLNAGPLTTRLHACKVLGRYGQISDRSVVWETNISASKMANLNIDGRQMTVTMDEISFPNVLDISIINNSGERIIAKNKPFPRLVDVPGSLSAFGLIGDYAVDADYTYECIGANSWTNSILTLQTSINQRLTLSGGTLSGPLTLSGDPTLSGQAANKFYVDSLGSAVKSFIYGDGSDGSVAIGGNTTLVRTMYYDNLSIGGAGILNTGGFKIFVRNALTVNGSINRNGNVGSNTVLSTGGAAGAALASADLGGGGKGSAGANGATAVGAIAAAVVATTPSLISGTGGGGGAGGAASAGSPAGGATGAGTANIFRPIRDLKTDLNLGIVVALGGSGGRGGSSGGGAGGNGGGGGGGASGGAVVAIFAKNINIAVTGSIRSLGGNGGNASAGIGNNAGGGGGGGGGCGGAVYMVFDTLTNLGSISAAGGTGGTGGLGLGTGLPGVSGTAGSAGRIQQYNLINKTLTVV